MEHRDTKAQSVIFFERTEFTEQKFGSMAFAYSIYLEAVLNLSCADLG